MADTMAPQVLTKAPWERRLFSMDFTNLLDSDETISSVVSVTSQLVGGGTSDLTIETASISGQTVRFWVSGGTNSYRYKIEARIESSGGQQLEGDGILKVRD